MAEVSMGICFAPIEPFLLQVKGEKLPVAVPQPLLQQSADAEQCCILSIGLSTHQLVTQLWQLLLGCVHGLG